MQGSRRDQRMGQDYLGEIWDEDEIEEEFHKFLKGKKKKRKELQPPPEEDKDDDDIQF